MSRLIRKAGLQAARGDIDSYLDRVIEARTWAGFELFVIGGYADPTGAAAARNVDLERAGAAQPLSRDQRAVVVRICGGGG